MADRSVDTPKYASLGSGLLARKGKARPAMRRPSAEMPHDADDESNDLGWNDMGDDLPQPSRAEASDKSRRGVNLAEKSPRSTSEIARQQHDIAHKLGAQVEDEGQIAVEEGGEAASPLRIKDRSIPSLPVADRSSAPQPQDTVYFDSHEAEAVIRPVVRDMSIKARAKGRGAAHDSAAFTLRLDAQRHLRLRLACALHNVSAQKFVTQALDQLLDSIPEIDSLVERVASK